MAALETRRYLQTQGHYYLCPLALTGKVPHHAHLPPTGTNYSSRTNLGLANLCF